ncbi:MAG: post-segregation antitoxin CcdA [Geminicoccaceae bacterium]|nr:MAG: post-segregation antitoxin CcdA [Geminicoccaceae bacterium]
MAEATTRVRTHVTVDRTLLEEAKAHGVSLSATLDEALRDKLRTARHEAYRRENAEAYAAANRWVEDYGLPFEDDRTF